MSHLKAIVLYKKWFLKSERDYINQEWAVCSKLYNTETTINIHLHKAQYAKIYNFIKLYPQSEWHY